MQVLGLVLTVLLALLPLPYVLCAGGQPTAAAGFPQPENRADLNGQGFCVFFLVARCSSGDVVVGYELTFLS